MDLRKSPWEALHEAYQIEGKRCWGEGFDGKIPGYIADTWLRDCELGILRFVDAFVDFTYMMLHDVIQI